MLECSRRLAREDRQLPIGPKPPVSVDCRDDGRFAIARTHGSHPVVGTVSADTLAHCFLSSADPAFLSHDRVSSAPCLRAAAQSHAATSTGIHTHLRALERHWLHSQRGGASCVFVCAQDRPTPHTAALTARLPHAHGGGCCGRSDSGLSCFLGCEVPFVVCVGDSNHRGVSRSSCCRRRARRSWSVRASPKSTPIPPKNRCTFKNNS